MLQNNTDRFGRIGVLMGGYSSEREISLKSGKAVFAALKECGCRVICLDIKSRSAESIASEIKAADIDLAFIALHGKLGEDGTIQEILDGLNIPYTGSAPEASRKALDKTTSQRLFKSHNIPVPDFWIFNKKEKSVLKAFIWDFDDFPVVVKPPLEGSSLGVGIAANTNELKRYINNAFKYGPDVLVEHYIKGRELTVGIIDKKALPVIEIRPKLQFFDFTAKYKNGMTQYLIPAPISQELSSHVRDIALKAHNLLGCRDFSRVDCMLDRDDNIYILEVNTIPGFTATSLLPKAAKLSGLSFTQLCLKLIGLAYAKKE